MAEKWLWVIPPFEKKLKINDYYVALLQHASRTEEKCPFHFCLGDITDLWYTQCMFDNTVNNFRVNFQSEKNFISGAEGHSWYLDTHTYLTPTVSQCIYFYFIFLGFVVLTCIFSKKFGFSSSSTLGKVVDLLLEAWFTFFFVKQILTIFAHVLALKQHKQDLSTFWGISLSMSVAWAAHLLQISQCAAK